ncbi:MAG: SDR family oxidoreductase [Bradymonadaceae bacterium]
MARTKVMVLTGCASGIGCHLARVLAEDGHRLVCTDINIDALEACAEANGWDHSKVLVRKLDVRQPLEWKQTLDEAVKRFGRIDVLMNVAGYLRPGYVHKISPGEVDMHMDVNVKGTIFGTQAAAAQMVKQGSGHIINVGSLASLAPVAGLSLYSASKFAVRGFTLAVAQELREHGVYVTLVLPDAVETPMLDLQADFEEAALTFSGTAPLTLKDIEEVILDNVLKNRPLEVTLPFGRGALARLATCLPDVSMWVAPVLRKKGIAAQQRLKDKLRDR